MALAITILIAVVFAVIGLVCVVTVAVGLPGVWMMLALAIVIEVADPLWLGPGQTTFSLWLLVGCGVVGLLGELLELGAGALGAAKAGSSARGTIGALLGGVAGAIAGIALPLPVVGSLIGAVAGTFVGAIAGELSIGQTTVQGAIKPATGATIGRILGTLSKIPIAAAVWAALTIAAFWP